MNPTELIIAKATYIDTIAILIDRQPPNSFFRELQNVRASYSFHPASRKARSCGARFRLTCQQPKENAVGVIANLCLTRKLLINELHVALDFCVSTDSDARLMGDWLNAHFVHRWRRSRTTIRRGASRYSTPQSWRCLVYASYSDRPSKALQLPCAHLELRAKGSQVVRRLGVNQLRDLLRLDLVALWKNRLVLENINYASLGRQYLRRGMGRCPFKLTCSEYHQRRTGYILASIAMNEPDESGALQHTAQSIHDTFIHEDWFRPRAALPRQDTTELLKGLQAPMVCTQTNHNNIPGNRYTSQKG